MDAKNNPMIVLSRDCHKAVNKAPRDIGVAKKTARESIAANADILMMNGIPGEMVDNIRQAALDLCKGAWKIIF
ncbi:hypothetical protein [Burkholderia gladioli]|uniref:Uncharacterized protein n=2 Tax=Burkholderia gladioli TaxID=28095 RepID=A0AB38TT66_BURGA|nr:hypothetical protein [Burkholderia gladioli]MBU9189669.1 hypothetical protein [Burkholderia gladioli]MBU9271272.1 hypothetical protein [Burkholderia gladioli]MBU9277986.1 hypothetical protein [Burkholderia gladioli]MBU9323474.1 hypothetical protein [Burkholderia gladioli]MBU9646283.1 hypothetical protein [Burkholderia gladioli]